MFRFTSLKRELWSFNRVFNTHKVRVNINRKIAVVLAITMFSAIGANLAIAVTDIANPQASSTTVAWRPRPAPPNREGSDDPSNTEGTNQQGNLLT